MVRARAKSRWAAVALAALVLGCGKDDAPRSAPDPAPPPKTKTMKADKAINSMYAGARAYYDEHPPPSDAGAGGDADPR